jgi:hypothetical protein
LEEEVQRSEAELCVVSDWHQMACSSGAMMGSGGGIWELEEKKKKRGTG